MRRPQFYGALNVNYRRKPALEQPEIVESLRPGERRTTGGRGFPSLQNRDPRATGICAGFASNRKSVGRTNLDFALSKKIPVHFEGQHLQAKGEFFNIFNHPNFDIPIHTFDLTPCGQSGTGLCPAGNYGAILSANAYSDKPPRQIQLSLKYVF